MSSKNFTSVPVGTMKTGRGTFQALIEKPYAPALKGLEEFSHVCILWWASKPDEGSMRPVTLCESPYKKGPSELGIFATRSPMRPNPICLSVCPVKSVDAAKGIVELWYADTDDGTPVLDIKPTHPSAVRVATPEPRIGARTGPSGWRIRAASTGRLSSISEKARTVFSARVRKRR